MNEDIFHLGIKAVIRNEKGEVFLLKTNPKKLIITDDWKGEAYWDIPGGRIKKKDNIENTLKREVEEETGIKNILKIIPFTMVLANIRIPVGEETVGLILSTFLCEVDSSEKIKISGEHLEDKWFTPKKASELLEYKYPKAFTEKLKKLSSK